MANRIQGETEKTVVNVPSRISVFVLDMNRLARGFAGGGGIAISSANYSRVIISKRGYKQDLIIAHNRLLIEYYLEKFRRMYAISDSYDIEVITNVMPHSGEGSTGSLVVGLLMGLFRINNIDILDNDLYSIYTNDVKEEHGTNLVGGYSSGPGALSVIKGGLVVLNEDLSQMRSVSIDERFRILIVRPKELHRLNYAEENQVIHGRGKRYDSYYREMKQDLLHMVFHAIDSSQGDNIEYILKLVSELTKLGSKIVETETMNNVYGGLYDYLKQIGDVNKVLLHGLTSLGPSYYYIDYWQKINELRSFFNTEKFFLKICRVSDGMLFS